MEEISICWFRRDLRLFDNHALHQAMQGKHPVLALFIFDRNILDELEKDDARLTYIHKELAHLNQLLQKQGSKLLTYYATPEDAWKNVLATLSVKHVFTNHDYEPYAKQRDKTIFDIVEAKGIPFSTYKDQVIFEGREIVTAAFEPYKIYTPYMKSWKKQLNEKQLQPFPDYAKKGNWYKTNAEPIISLKAMGFTESSQEIPAREVPDTLIKKYDKLRDYPFEEGTSRLGIHLRFGTLSIREQVKRALKLNETWLNELIWREFYMQILDNFPEVVGSAFKAKYDKIPWRNNEEEFEKWCAGETGVPMVDAGMRQLNTTGYMHNRVRMIVASFLAKNLLIDWRWGEAYFAKKLLDYELANNNGGWQWAAGSGVDAQPYFRVFNPESQAKTWDPDGQYIRKWVPELDTDDYPEPMVDLKESRKRAIEFYKKALAG